jgi:hypothetical protein
MGKSNIIEINGRRYDAHSGELLDAHVAMTEPSRPANGAARPVQAQQPAVKHASVQSAVTTQPVPATKPAAKTRVHDAVKARAQGRRPQRSTTLMRSAVSKPGESLKRHAKAQSHVDALVDKPAARLRPKASVHRISDKRLRHAQAISKSQSVSRFTQPHGPAPDPPVHLPARQPKPAEFPASHLTSMLQATARASQSLDDIVEQALQQATSHLEPVPVIQKRRLFGRASD